MASKTAQIEEKQEQGNESDKFKEINTFLQETKPPSNLKNVQQKLSKFISDNSSSNRHFVLITSGGTTVPLELNTVRFIDNFSTGTRGAASCEYFLKHDCNVIFLHRTGSICPFTRHVQYETSKHFDLNFFETLTMNEDKISINLKDKNTANIKEAFAAYNKYKNDRLLVLEYESVYDYFCLTIEACKALKDVSNRCILYMACAVSDFYIPFKELATDKIQSSGGPLQLELKNTPKMLGYFKHLCGEKCMLVSFKLETKNDTEFLFMKARRAIKKYASDVVCSNILHSRRYEAWMVTKDEAKKLELKQSKYKELEEEIVLFLLDMMKDKK